MEQDRYQLTSSKQTYLIQAMNVGILVRTDVHAGAKGVDYKCDICRNNCEYAEHKYACLSECDLIC
jgi:hypothetical protein